MSLWLLKAGKIFISLHIGPQHYYFPLALWAGFRSLMEVLEKAEDHNQPENQSEAIVYLIIHTDDTQ